MKSRGVSVVSDFMGFWLSEALLYGNVFEVSIFVWERAALPLFPFAVKSDAQ